LIFIMQFLVPEFSPIIVVRRMTLAVANRATKVTFRPGTN
jgi:hypothetical protein